MRRRSLFDWFPVNRLRRDRPTVAVLRLDGVIGAIGPLRRGLSLTTLAGPIERAFKLRGLKAVALAINSPGGSPVQSAMIARRVRALADEAGIPVFAFAEDVAGSGGYWLACAADEIFSDENSIIGSIGVRTGGFGFAGLIKRFGIERRIYTAGERKAMLDPFLREDADDVTRLGAIQHDVHESFKTLVRTRRQGKLKAPEDELFSGEFWTGRRALELGLIDGIGDLRTVMRERFGRTVRLRPVGARRAWRRRLAPGADGAAAWAPVSARLGAGPGPGEWAAEVIAALEERVLWSRFGL
ncbi:MAG: S49 family peptidase [Rhodospirillales bacterium]|nr:S49 family peptidase [Rhodospirillales bacterium]